MATRRLSTGDNQRAKHVTLADVAQRAGVSATTASFVLNGRGGEAIPTRTRERVQQAARDLRYVKSAIVTAQREGRSQALGVHFNNARGIIPSDPVMMRVLAGISEAAQEREYHLVLYTGLPVSIAAAPPVESFLDRRVDGLLLIAPVLMDPLLAELADARLPSVVLFSRHVPAGIGFVDADNVGGARQAVEYLLGLGHRRIAYVTDSLRSANFADRYSGYVAALAEHGIAVDPALISRKYDESGVEILRSLMGLPDPPSAVFCYNDGAAVGILRAAADLGLRVPETLSIMGFDDSVLATTVSPPLTTIRQPLEMMGRSAALALCDLLAGTASPDERRILVSTELIARGTTAPNINAPSPDLASSLSSPSLSSPSLPSSSPHRQ
ncbi:MAG: LacI family DNA-binding transcriptional regulator [Cytophagales bacterium]|nr:LacI family DNA-binding transcriptional regulator [Armatimonadota bacterium]